jgi:pimeloyl-ACP methyl ester carboxylesterase
MWKPVSDLLEGVTLVAPDLRGRAASAPLPGPWGMAAHVKDAVAVLDHLGIERAMVVGGSMGGYVAVLMAALHPDRIASVGLCDGGVALPLPEGADPDQLLQATLGPTFERLDRIFPSWDAYMDFWKAHPALSDHWNDDIEAYVRYDATETDGGVRTRVVKEAIVADGRDLLVNREVHTCIANIRCPIWLLRAPRGLLNQPAPLIPDEVLAAWRGDNLPQLEEAMVEDVNHFTLFLTDRGASAIAERIRSSVPAHA